MGVMPVPPAIMPAACGERLRGVRSLRGAAWAHAGAMAWASLGLRGRLLFRIIILAAERRACCIVGPCMTCAEVSHMS